MNHTRLKGGHEPRYVRAARMRYYQGRRWRMDLEERIGRTDRGLIWLMRVRRAGLA